MNDFITRTIDLEWFLLLAIIPASFFLPEYRLGFLLVIPLFWLIRKIATGQFLPSTPFNLVIAIIGLMIAVSYLVTFDEALSLPRIGNIFLGIGLFFAGIQLSHNKSWGIWAIVGSLLIGGLVIAMMGLLGSVWLPPFEYLNSVSSALPVKLNSIPGTVGGIINSNELAGVLCWLVPIPLAFLIGQHSRLWARNKLLSVILFFSTGLSTFILVATLSRGAILGFSVGLALIMGLYVQPRWRLVLGIGLIVAAFVLIFYYQDIPDTSKPYADTIGINSRLEIWNRALLTLEDFPITGVSVNGFRRVVHAFYPLFATSSEIDIAHAHNHLLQTALDIGLPGLIAYLGLWLIAASLLYQSWKFLSKRKRYNSVFYALVAGLSGSLVAGWMFGIFDAIGLGARPSFIWWILLGLVASTHYAVLYESNKLRRYRRVSAAHVHQQPVTVPTVQAAAPTIKTRPANQHPQPNTSPNKSSIDAMPDSKANLEHPLATRKG